MLLVYSRKWAPAMDLGSERNMDRRPCQEVATAKRIGIARDCSKTV